MSSSVTEYVSSQDASTLLWIAALLAAACAAAIVYAARERHLRQKEMSEKQWRSRSSLRSRGA